MQKIKIFESCMLAELNIRMYKKVKNPVRDSLTTSQINNIKHISANLRKVFYTYTTTWHDSNCRLITKENMYIGAAHVFRYIHAFNRCAEIIEENYKHEKFTASWSLNPVTFPDISHFDPLIIGNIEIGIHRGLESTYKDISDRMSAAIDKLANCLGVDEVNSPKRLSRTTFFNLKKTTSLCITLQPFDGTTDTWLKALVNELDEINPNSLIATSTEFSLDTRMKLLSNLNIYKLNIIDSANYLHKTYE